MRPIYQIYIEEQLIDIDPKTVIAITLQASDLASGDITSRKASFTNQIKIPVTNNNVTIFEFANNPKSGSAFPYTKKQAKILCNGILIFDGIVILRSFDTYFNAEFYSSGLDLSQKIANLYLSDVDFEDSPIDWDQTFMDSVRASTSGWCAPAVGYGIAYVISDFYLPSISYKDTLTAILKNAGYTVSGSFYDNDTTFNNMVLTFGRSAPFSGAPDPLVFYRFNIKMNYALSNTILQSDFLKDFLIKFGAFFRINNLTSNIEIVTLEEILNNVSESIDWTQKRVKNKKDIVQYTLQSFGQMNNFTYPVTENNGAVFGFRVNPNVDGSLDIPNELLPQRKDVYQSIFESPNFLYRTSLSSPFSDICSITTNNLGAITGEIHGITSSIYNDPAPSSFAFDYTPKPMLGVLRDINATELLTGTCEITYDGNPRSDYKIADFGDYYNVASGHDYLEFGSLYHGDGLLDSYYPSLQRILNEGVIKTTHEYFLTDLDINSLDLLTPIFDDGNYYLINKVNSYVSGKTTRVELLKI